MSVVGAGIVGNELHRIALADENFLILGRIDHGINTQNFHRRGGYLRLTSGLLNRPVELVSAGGIQTVYSSPVVVGVRGEGNRTRESGRLRLHRPLAVSPVYCGAAVELHIVKTGSGGLIGGRLYIIIVHHHGIDAFAIALLDVPCEICVGRIRKFIEIQFYDIGCGGTSLWIHYFSTVIANFSLEQSRELGVSCSRLAFIQRIHRPPAFGVLSVILAVRGRRFSRQFYLASASAAHGLVGDFGCHTIII